MFGWGVIGYQEDADWLCPGSILRIVLLLMSKARHCPVLGGHSTAATATQWSLGVIILTLGGV